MRRDELFLKDIVKAMEKIFNYTEEMTKKEFKNDDLIVDAVLRNIEIIGEAANSVSDEIHEKYKDVPWRRMIGLRNIVIHEYFGVNIKRVWKVVAEDISDLKKNIVKIRKNLIN